MIALCIFIFCLMFIAILMGFIIAIASGAVGVVGAILIVAIEIIIGLFPIILIISWVISKIKKKD